MALAARGRHLSPLPRLCRGSDPTRRRLRGASEPRSLRRRRPPLDQGPSRPRGGETAVLKIDVVYNRATSFPLVIFGYPKILISPAALLPGMTGCYFLHVRSEPRVMSAPD